MDAFEKATCLLPHVVVDAVLETRQIMLPKDQHEWFHRFVDMFMRYHVRNKTIFGRQLIGHKGRDYAYAFTNHWLDAMRIDGFEKYKARHPLEAIKID